MPKPLGPQWLKLYRGVSEVPPDNVDMSHIGEHWTTEPSVARAFATDGFDTGDRSGTVLEAVIHRRHVIDPTSKEATYWKEHHGVMSPESPEKEKTIRTGAIVHVQKMHHVNYNSGELESQEVPTSIRRVRGRA